MGKGRLPKEVLNNQPKGRGNREAAAGDSIVLGSYTRGQ
jgi:hypothetical protein